LDFSSVSSVFDFFSSFLFFFADLSLSFERRKKMTMRRKKKTKKLTRVKRIQKRNQRKVNI
jgi:hypothetical protein